MCPQPKKGLQVNGLVRDGKEVKSYVYVFMRYYAFDN